MTSQPHDTHQSKDAASDTSASARRAYWTQQMDLSAAFMDRAVKAPLAECGEPLACLRTAAVDSGVEVIFSDQPYSTGHARLYYLRKGLIPGFIAAAKAINDQGWVMKVEDGLRTLDMQINIGRQPAVFDKILKTILWECGDTKPTPAFVLNRYRALVAVNAKVGTHISASAIDISVYDRQSKQEIDRGAPYLETSELTPMKSPFVSQKAQDNRKRITELMATGGFLAYPYEFWHYNAGDSYEHVLLNNGPGRYGPVNTHLPELHVTPVAEPEAPLNTATDMTLLITQAMARLSPDASI